MLSISYPQNDAKSQICRAIELQSDKEDINGSVPKETESVGSNTSVVLDGDGNASVNGVMS